MCGLDSCSGIGTETSTSCSAAVVMIAPTTEWGDFCFQIRQMQYERRSLADGPGGPERYFHVYKSLSFSDLRGGFRHI